jgi:hypothetical protein
VTLRAGGVGDPAGPSQALSRKARTLTLGPWGFAFLPVTGRLTLAA